MPLARTTTVVSTKGQVILPKAIRDSMQWSAGTSLIVQQTEDGVLLTGASAPFPATRPEDVFGCLSHTGPARTLAEMDAAILEEARRRHARD